MPLDYPIATCTLDNGLRVVVSSDHLVPRVSINVWVDAGSGHEQPTLTGLAHLFEHLMFEGSEHVEEGEHFHALMGHGGACNATTSFDRTTYVESVPTGALDLALWLEADRHLRLLPAVTQANLDNQRDVVVEEKRQRYDNQPYGDAFARMCQAVFPGQHPYRHPPIGDLDHLLGASLSDVHSFYRDHYGPSTTTVALVGDVRPEQAFALVEKHFGAAGDTTVPRPCAAPPLAPLAAPQTLVVEGDVPSERVYTAFRLPAVTDRDFTAAALALDVLAGLSVSSLHQRLVRREETSTGCGAAGLGLRQGTSLGYLAVDVSDDAGADQVDQAVVEELTRLAQDGPTPDQLRAAVAGAERSYLEMLAATDERAEVLARSTVVEGDPEHLNRHPDDLAAVTAEDIARVTGDWLSPRSRAVLTYRRGPADVSDPVEGVA